MILPVLHGMTRDEVLKLSPLLADKWAIPSDKNLDVVVAAIRAAISLSERTREITKPQGSVAAIHALTSRIDSIRTEYKRIHANDAGDRAHRSGLQIIEEVKALINISDAGKTSGTFAIVPGFDGGMSVWGPYGMFVYLAVHAHVMNNADEAEFTAAIGKGTRDPYSDIKTSKYETLTFKPRMVEEEVVHWEQTSDKDQFMTSAEVAEMVLNRFVAKIATFAER